MRLTVADRAEWRPGVFESNREVLRIVTEATAEEVEPSDTSGVGFDADANADQPAGAQLKVGKRHARQPDAINCGTTRRHAPSL